MLTSVAASLTSRAHGSRPCRWIAERVDVSTKVCEAPAALQLVVEILELLVRVHESFVLLVVPALELVVGLVPQVVAVSLVQCIARLDASDCTRGLLD